MLVEFWLNVMLNDDTTKFSKAFIIESCEGYKISAEENNIVEDCSLIVVWNFLERSRCGIVVSSMQALVVFTYARPPDDLWSQAAIYINEEEIVTFIRFVISTHTFITAE